jgi:hypothetical protein
LVDLDLESPTLGAEARATLEEGIVDAFLLDVPLDYAAREQEPSLYYIGTGSQAADPEKIWASPRWKRLARGFRTQGAVMVLYLSPAGLAKLVLEPDGLVILAPRGYDPSVGAVPGIKRMVQAGVPVMAVVTRAAPLVARTAIGGERIAPSRLAGLVAVCAVAAAVAWIGSRQSGRDLAEPAAVRSGEGIAAEQEGAGDSLFYSVQVAAFSSPAQAAGYAKELARAGEVATVAPVRLGSQGVWYRVLLGALPTPAAADSLLRGLWERGLVKRPDGTILRTPFALEVGDASPRDIGALGLAFYAVKGPGGSERILTGAFEDSSQTRLADSLLGAVALRGKLVRRVGIRP